MLNFLSNYLSWAFGLFNYDWFQIIFLLPGVAFIVLLPLYLIKGRIS